MIGSSVMHDALPGSKPVRGDEMVTVRRAGELCHLLIADC
jgi:hypothetical protein